MREDWDRRAAENAYYYINTARMDWTEKGFFEDGAVAVQAYILNDMGNICQGKGPEEMCVLEIGCGAGRVTRALARVFGAVHAVDVSGGMVRLARRAVPTAHIYQNNGMDLSVIPWKVRFDFAFSCYVFQHILDRAIIQSYMRGTRARLEPGTLFKFQMQGDPLQAGWKKDNWSGATWTEEQILALAAECGFESRYRVGKGEQDYWQWFFAV